MTGNTGNTGNTGHAGNAGLDGDAGGGWFVPGRADFPFPLEVTRDGTEIGTFRRAVFVRDETGPGDAGRRIAFRSADAPTGRSLAFEDRSWAGRWYAYRVLREFAAAPWDEGLDDALAAMLLALNDATGDSARGRTAQEIEIDALLAMARDERAPAMGEILAQDVEFVTAFMEALSVNPGSHPRTYRVLHVASLVGSFAALRFKEAYDRPRPSFLCPALLPPLPVPGHSSFPSGHATQAWLMARCIAFTVRLSGLPQAERRPVDETVKALARRVARNREIAGLHYRSDSVAGRRVADAAFAVLSRHESHGLRRTDYALPTFGEAALAAARELNPDLAVPAEGR
ncbi:phosphatase PAP2 family protein [Methylobacterium terricola]|uniref:Phosphatase PAP2 family protein n=1 Tax=Methylobacterium terricola TaxID=2583531 RepID=A0A5C4LKY7_9HYPH|nr:phosphatase PAP2 family protein [Methylobacterium terricola]TNC15166.1 phosphatase PAP2 family protein [Methylobacterium terricola]